MNSDFKIETRKAVRYRLIAHLFLLSRARLLVIGLLLLANFSLEATTYYVDAQNGSDNYDGLAPAFQGGNTGPWATLAKVNSIFFAPGDSILLRRGAVWTDGPLEPRIGGAPGGVVTVQESIVGQPLSFGHIDLADNNCIYFGAYGNGATKPLIDGRGGRGIILRHDYLIVEGIHIDNVGTNALWFGKPTGTYWNAVIDVDVTNCSGNAVRSEFGGGNLWLKGLYIYNYGTNGILLSGSPNNPLKGVLAEDCHVENPVVLELEDAITCHDDELGNHIDGDVIIRNNTIINSGEDGIDITSGTRILLDGNNISNSMNGGIFIAKSWVSTVEARGNFLYSNSISQGVGDLTIRVPNVWAYNNIIAGTGHHCLHVANTDNTRIWHNVIAPGARTGNLIWLRDSIGHLDIRNNIFDFSGSGQEISGPITPGIVFDYNCYFSDSSSDHVYENYSFQEYRNANPLFEPNGFWADPRFADPAKAAPGHFQLLGSSLCINSGTPVSVARDFQGTPRPQGAGYDIGAYERGAVDCDPGPGIIAYPGSPCDDGDPTTANDAYDANCNCAGTPTACFGIGDADGDGVCTDVDCDDDNPGIAYQPGAPCDDGNPATSGEVIQNDCTCGGGVPGPAFVCSRVRSSNDDAEEKDSGNIELGSSDLELVYDPNRGLQVIGLRFTGLNIPQGATVLNAHIQFFAEDTLNINPCRLRIYGESSDSPQAFIDTDFNISGRPATAASVSWAPPDWQAYAVFGPGQRTPNIYAILQELVNRPGYNPAEAIVIIIEGIGARTAVAFEGFPAQAPELCVEYTQLAAIYDCPALSANIGYPCDDGDPATVNDAIDANCNCSGTPTVCTGIGDADGDGICSDVDCDDNDFYTAYAPGSPCDDGDNTSINDTIDNNCNCSGTPTPCTGIGDNDGDGVCSDVDCDDNDPDNTARPGDACDDGDPNTSGEVIQLDCTCSDTPPESITTCARIAAEDDDAEEDDSGSMDLTSSDLELAFDGSNQKVGMRFSGLNIPQGAAITAAYIQFTVDETQNLDPCNLTIRGEASDNAGVFSSGNNDVSNRPLTGASVAWAPPAWSTAGEAGAPQQTPDIAAVIQEIVGRNGYTSASSIVILIEGTGRRTAESFDGVSSQAPELCVSYLLGQPSYDCPALSANIGDACDDGDITTVNDTLDADCNCTGIPTNCTGIGDNDGDGACADVDCDDNDPAITSQAGDACDDGDPNTTGDTVQEDCTCSGSPVSPATTACARITSGNDDAEEGASGSV
ncbi:MAG: right-handed parallel beta-helix repeat-containing protein, partial [Phaeodactylibacter sp.]|nr:right-handed parallel beta-helix repeat-containing protein [Phaeodactylibacter sp.]